MRIPFTTIMWLLLSEGSHAELTIKSARPLLPVVNATKRHLRVHEPTHNDADERGITAELIASASKPVFSHESIEKWTEKKLSTDAVFELLTLDKAGNNLLSHANFALLDNYARKQSQTSLIETLTTQCGEDGLAKIIEAAKQVPHTARLAKRLQKEQFRYWVVQKKDPSDVFKTMKLDEAGDKIFEQPQVITWVDFFDYFNRLDLKEGKSLLDYFEAYDVSSLVQMLIAAKTVPSTERLAVRLQAELTLRWLEERKTPKEVLQLLNLNKDSFFENPLFTAWMKYLDDFNTKLPTTERKTALATLHDTYGVDGLDEIVAKANASPTTERISTEMTHNLLTGWIEKELTLTDVNKMVVSASPAEGNLRKSILIRASIDYAKSYIIRSPHDVKNVVFALKRLGDDGKLVEMLIRDSMQLASHKTAVYMLKVLLGWWASHQRDVNEVRKLILESKTGTDHVRKKLVDAYEIMCDQYRTKRIGQKRKRSESDSIQGRE